MSDASASATSRGDGFGSEGCTLPSLRLLDARAPRGSYRPPTYVLHPALLYRVMPARSELELTTVDVTPQLIRLIKAVPEAVTDGRRARNVLADLAPSSVVDAAQAALATCALGLPLDLLTAKSSTEIIKQVRSALARLLDQGYRAEIAVAAIISWSVALHETKWRPASSRTPPLSTEAMDLVKSTLAQFVTSQTSNPGGTNPTHEIRLPSGRLRFRISEWLIRKEQIICFVLLILTAAMAYPLGDWVWAASVHPLPTHIGSISVSDLDRPGFLASRLTAGASFGLMTMGLFLVRPSWRGRASKAIALGIVLILTAIGAWFEAPGLADENFRTAIYVYTHSGIDIFKIPDRCRTDLKITWESYPTTGMIKWTAIPRAQPAGCTSVTSYAGSSPRWSYSAPRGTQITNLGLYNGYMIVGSSRPTGLVVLAGINLSRGKAVWTYTCTGKPTGRVIFYGALRPGSTPGPIYHKRTAYIYIRCPGKSGVHRLLPSTGKPA